MASTSGPGSRSRRPTTRSVTPSSWQRAVSVRRWRAKNRIRALTSCAGRFQLSEEKANSVRAVTPCAGAASMTRRTAVAPTRWPAVRSRPRRSAQRPFPSMMIAVCRELCVIKYVLEKKLPSARGVNQGFHVIEIPLQRPAAGSGQAVFGAGRAALERLGAGDVVGVLELARMHAEVAVGDLEQTLELVEAGPLHTGERRHDAQADPLVDQAIELGGGAGRAAGGGRGAARGGGMPDCVRFSHRTSARSTVRRRYAGRRNPRRAASSPLRRRTAPPLRAPGTRRPSPAPPAPRTRRPSRPRCRTTAAKRPG